MDTQEEKSSKEAFELLSEDERMEYLEKGIIFGEHKLKKKRKTDD